MLHESVLKLYRRLRLDGYRKLFGAVQEREGSLSAMEAFSADLINLLGEPTLKEFAEYSGISQPNATYKVNALASKGYVEKVVSAPDRREIRLRTGKKFAQYFDEDRPVICAAAERCARSFQKKKLTRRGGCWTHCWRPCRMEPVKKADAFLTREGRNRNYDRFI